MRAMRGLTAILLHEIAERRLLLLASPLVGLIAFAAPLLSAGGPGAGAANSELRDTAALFLTLALSGLGALLLGASAIDADLASRRLAFFFSRPLSGRVRVLISRYQSSGENALEVDDLDLASRQWVGLATLPHCSWLHFVSPDASRVACNSVRSGTVKLFDLASGRQLAELRQPGAKVRASYLADGRLAMQVVGPAGTELTLLDGDGRRRTGAARFRLPPGVTLGWFRTPSGAFTWLAQADADRLLAREVPAGRGRISPGLWKLLDLAQGRTRALGAQGLQLLPPFAFSPATSAPLFTDGTHLVQIDLARGKRHALGPARPYHNALWDPW